MHAVLTQAPKKLEPLREAVSVVSHAGCNARGSLGGILYGAMIEVEVVVTRLTS